MPTYLLMSILVVLVIAIGFVAARSGTPERDSVGADDVADTPLPTPVPLETGTPLPTPVPMEQGAVVDTAVTFWGAWLPDEVTDALNEIAASRSRSSTTTSPQGDQPGTLTASASAAPSATDDPPPLLVPLPLSTPLPTLAPLPSPLPSVDLPLSTPTLPPLLP